MGDVIRVAIGSEPKTVVMEQVLVHSISRRTKSVVEIVPMRGPEWEYDRSGVVQGTGFSCKRWRLAEYFGWEGRAIYVDADIQFFCDVADLWSLPDRNPAPAGTSAWLTYQPSKFSKSPHPNSSVMVVDCAAAKSQWGFHLDRVMDYLRKNTSKQAYGELMYPNWMAPPPARIGDEWNSLCIYNPGSTKVLHHTHESSQPGFCPDTMMARLWRAELVDAIKAGAVSKSAFEHALSKWGVKEDWRNQNGLHPVYKKYLPLFPR